MAGTESAGHELARPQPLRPDLVTPPPTRLEQLEAVLEAARQVWVCAVDDPSNPRGVFVGRP
jgi:hypothetical protein